VSSALPLATFEASAAKLSLVPTSNGAANSPPGGLTAARRRGMPYGNGASLSSANATPVPSASVASRGASR
jgi:hypothetical protein